MYITFGMRIQPRLFKCWFYFNIDLLYDKVKFCFLGQVIHRFYLQRGVVRFICLEKFNYDFQTSMGNFQFGRMCLHCIRASCNFLLQRQNMTDRAEIIQKNHPAIVQPSRKPHGLSTEVARKLMRWPCGGRTETAGRLPPGEVAGYFQSSGVVGIANT